MLSKVQFIMKISHLILLSIISLFSCSDEPNQSVNNFEFNFPMDCCTIDQFEISGIRDLESENLRIYTPCVFVPDGPTTNNIYLIQTNDQIDTIKRIEVSDMDGKIIFVRENFPSNDMEFGWNGKLDQINQEGAFKIKLNFISKQNTEISISYIICALNCERNQPFLSGYDAVGLDFNNLRWPNQHDGNGGFDVTAPIEQCQ